VKSGSSLAGGWRVGHPAVRSAHQIARELLQEFVNNNVLFIGYGDAEGFPWFTVTEYGRKCIAEGNLLPFDPEGYLGALSKRVPGLDAIALTYLREAISTYNRGFYLSSAVSLGVASEHLVLRLIDAYVKAQLLDERPQVEQGSESLARVVRKDSVTEKTLFLLRNEDRNLYVLNRRAAL
jgi:hypothetical protein